jgi:aryl-alcohol dehydrogenase-like predicted oxidoreductase
VRSSEPRKALERSLQRLGLPRVDLYQVHWPYPPVPIETWVLALADAAREGLIGAIGVSNYNAGQTRRAVAVLGRRGLTLASNQVEYSLLQRNIERNGVLDACWQLGVTVIAYSPLAMGLLAGRYGPANPPPGLRRRMYLRRDPAKLVALQELLREIGAARGKTPAQVALNWVICQGALPIPGAKTAHQARENAGALGWRLSPDELAALDRASSAAGA